MAIRIPVSAQFDAADLKQQIQMVNDQIRILASQVGQANKQKFEPINLKSKEDLDAFVKQMQKLLKIQTELAQQMGKTGQGNKNPLMADWKKMYGDQAERIKKMQEMLQFMGVEFDDMPAPKPRPPAPPGGGKPPSVPASPPAPVPSGGLPNWRTGWGAQGLNVMQSGLRAAGPVGGVFSSALGSGISAGAGAGLMGLVGGLAALGVGKIVGAIADKVAQAQDNAIGLDKLYRQIGGVASYAALKGAIGGAGGLADTLGMKTSDAINMASAYSRANLRPGENAMTGLLTAGGMARTFGMDPNAVAGTMGRLRGANIGRSDQETRRIGMLMGEAIGRSGAFGQANEAMEAITNYASTQARQSLTGPSIAGYGGALSGLMQTGLPGMDVQGASMLLNRINSALTHGGNMGEASQAFTARVGMRAGLNPFQLRAFQEGGMFATRSSMFGADTPYGRAFGAAKGGSDTYFDMVKAQMGKQYGSGSQEYYMALANHLGTGVNEAMALDRAPTSQLSGADTRVKRLGLNVNASLMSQMGIIEGGGAGLGSMAKDYLSRKDLNDSERTRLMSAYKGTDVEKLKDVMMELVSAHGGTKTEGSQIRDNVAKLDNTLTRFADRALPALDIMRMALVKIAGVGDEASLRQGYIDQEKSRGKRRIDMRFDNANRDLQAQLNMVTGNDAEANAKRKAIIDKQNANNRQRDIETKAMDARVNAIAGGGASVSEMAYNTDGLGYSPAAYAEGNLAGNNVGNVKNADGSWARYGSRIDGIAASAGQMLRYRSGAFRNSGKQRMTLREMIKTYAPGSDGNDVANYVKFVSSRAGVNPDTPIDLRDEKVMQKITGAMLIMENRKNANIPEAEIAAGVKSALSNPRNFTQDYPMGLNKIAPNTMPTSGGEIRVTAAPMEVHHKDSSGQVIKTEQVPLKSSFAQPNSFASRTH